jgi:hypothetical protein
MHHKPLMLHVDAMFRIVGQAVRLREAEKKVRAYLAEIGRRGGITSRRDLTKSHARQMVAIREMKRAALREGKSWPPRDRKLIKLS